MRTPQEERIEKALFELIKNAGKFLTVNFIAKSDLQMSSRAESEKKTQAYKWNTRVTLNLIEPTNPAELNEWADAIIKAEELVDGLIKERYHEYQNPNYFKAIIAKYNGLENKPND